MLTILATSYVQNELEYANNIYEMNLTKQVVIDSDIR